VGCSHAPSSRRDNAPPWLHINPALARRTSIRPISSDFGGRSRGRGPKLQNPAPPVEAGLLPFPGKCLEPRSDATQPPPDGAPSASEPLPDLVGRETLSPQLDHLGGGKVRPYPRRRRGARVIARAAHVCERRACSCRYRDKSPETETRPDRAGRLRRARALPKHVWEVFLDTCRPAPRTGTGASPSTCTFGIRTTR